MQVRQLVNEKLGSLKLRARFGTSERSALNGNDLTQLLADPSALPDIINMISPLYTRMMPQSLAADAKQTNQALKKAERAAKAAAEQMKTLHKAGAKAGAVRSRRMNADDFDDLAGVTHVVAARVAAEEMELARARREHQTFEERFEEHIQHIEQVGSDDLIGWLRVC